MQNKIIKRSFSSLLRIQLLILNILIVKKKMELIREWAVIIRKT